MAKKQKALYFGIMSTILFSTNSFGMMLEDNFEQHSASSNLLLVQKSNAFTYDFIPSSSVSSQKEEVNYEKELANIHGKNKSSFPLSEKMYMFIISKVGKENKRPFIFKTGPQILFEDEINLLK